MQKLSLHILTVYLFSFLSFFSYLSSGHTYVTVEIYFHQVTYWQLKKSLIENIFRIVFCSL